MASIEDFIIKERGNQNFANLYLDKIEKHGKKKLRLLENRDSNMIKKYVKLHQYLTGVYDATCNMTEANVTAGNPCPFCVNFINEINKVDKEHFDWLKTLSIVNVVETNKFNDEVAKATNQKAKVIFNDGNVIEIGNTFSKDVSTKLNDEQTKVYNNFYIRKQRIEGKLAKTVFFAPVFDYATDEVKIYKFSPAIWNAIENSFTKAGYDYTSADFIITHNAVQGNWWSVSKKDSSPISEEAMTKYNAIKANIEKEVEKKSTIPSVDAQQKAFQKHKDAIAKKTSESTDDDEDVMPVEAPKAQQQAAAPVKTDVVDLF